MVVFEDSVGVMQMFLCAENESIMEVPSTKLLDGIIHLMAAYYMLGSTTPAHVGHLSCFFKSL